MSVNSLYKGDTITYTDNLGNVIEVVYEYTLSENKHTAQSDVDFYGGIDIIEVSVLCGDELLDCPEDYVNMDDVIRYCECYVSGL